MEYQNTSQIENTIDLDCVSLGGTNIIRINGKPVFMLDVSKRDKIEGYTIGYGTGYSISASGDNQCTISQYTSSPVVNIAV